ncbi:MAG: hypothetical protein WAZ18_05825 [Alphaproteobacteria bacterium]
MSLPPPIPVLSLIPDLSTTMLDRYLWGKVLPYRCQTLSPNHSLSILAQSIQSKIKNIPSHYCPVRTWVSYNPEAQAYVDAYEPPDTAKLTLTWGLLNTPNLTVPNLQVIIASQLAKLTLPLEERFTRHAILHGDATAATLFGRLQTIQTLNTLCLLAAPKVLSPTTSTLGRYSTPTLADRIEHLSTNNVLAFKPRAQGKSR